VNRTTRIATFFRLTSRSVIKRLRAAFDDLPDYPDPKTVFLKLRELEASGSRGAKRDDQARRRSVSGDADMMAVAIALHTLGPVVWVGGMFAIYVCLRPALGTVEPPQRMRLMRVTFQKFFPWVWTAMGDRTGLSDKPTFDQYWLGMLAEAAEMKPLRLGDAKADIGAAGPQTVNFSEIANEFSVQHRAEPDAGRLAAIYARACGVSVAL
jgi:hypothetical protein